MDMKLSKRGDYVVRSALCLARAYDEGTRRKIRDVVADMGVPKGFASQILLDLVHPGIAVSQAGKDGGYLLSRSPEEITLLELVEAGEGDIGSERCALDGGPCRWDTVCPLHETWTKAVAALRDSLAGTSLAELLRRDRSIEAGTYPIPPDAHRSRSEGIAVEDSVQVEVPAELAELKLGSGGGWLDPLAVQAHGEGEELRIRIGPGAASWLAKAVTVHVGSARRSGEETLIPLSWDATGVPGLFPRLVAELRIRAVDPERAELSLTGHYLPPLGRTGQLLDEALLGRLARSTVRSFLRRVARALDEPTGDRRAGGERSGSGQDQDEPAEHRQAVVR